MIQSINTMVTKKKQSAKSAKPSILKSMTFSVDCYKKSLKINYSSLKCMFQKRREGRTKLLML